MPAKLSTLLEKIKNFTNISKKEEILSFVDKRKSEL
jgi:hypothetical protein